MSGYTGKSRGGLKSRNFGGIDNNTTIVNIADNAAYDIVNFDIAQKGSIRRRNGFTSTGVTIGRLANPHIYGVWSFPDLNGVTRFSAIAYNNSGSLKMHTASSITGTWAEVDDAVYTENDDTKYQAIAWKGKLIIVNGTDAPTMLEYGVGNRTLKNLSYLNIPTRFAVLNTGVGYGTGQPYHYGVCAKTPVGKTPVITVFTGGASNTDIAGAGTQLDGISRYFTVSWDPVPGSSGYEIYVYDVAGSGTRGGGTNRYLKVADVNAGVYTWQDTAGPYVTENGVVIEAQTVNGAYNTPLWETYGFPSGGCVVARDREERLLLWAGSTVYGSALGDPLNWWATGDAMVFAVAGDGEVEIVAGANLFDYLMLFSSKKCWVYTGAGSQSMALEKTIPVGCASKDSIIQVGTDMYLFSQFGPTSFNRIMSGADIKAAHGWADKVKNTLFDGSNVNRWNRICAYNDIPNSRVVWTLPSAGSSYNDIALAYGYDIDGWVRYDNYGFRSFVDHDYSQYALSDGEFNALFQVNTGNTDDGTPITATYKTGWFDYETWDTQKRLVLVDVVASREGGAYTFEVSWSWDYDRMTGGPVACTETTTDGCAIQTTSVLSTEHQVFTDGIGHAVQLIFTTSAGDQVVEILGWRPDARAKGIRRQA